MDKFFIIGSVVMMLLFVPEYVYPQGYVGDNPGNGTQVNTRPGGFVQEIPLEAPKTEGNSYLFEAWLVGTVYLINDNAIDGLPIRYDLNNHGLEIKATDEVKFLPENQIDKFSFTTQTGEVKQFVNPRAIMKVNPDIPNVFLEVVEKGQWSLYKQTSAVIVRGNYNAVLDMGNRNNKMVKKSSFILSKSHGESAFLMDKSKKKFSSHFSNKAEVYSFLKEKKINLKDEEALKRVIIFLNELG